MRNRPATKTDAVLAIGFAVAALLAGAVTAEETKAAAGTPAKPKLTIKWSTSSEVDNYGFWIMRGDAENGPFKEANTKLVAGAGNSDLPRKYAFDDLNVEMGRTYYYYLDAISTKGVREKYSPVMAKQCCDTAETKAPESREIDPDKAPHTPAAPPAPPTPPSS